MGIGREGPEIRFAVVAIFDDVNMSTRADFKLQMLSMHGTRRTSVSPDLSTGLMGNSQTCLGCLFLSPGGQVSPRGYPQNMLNSSTTPGARRGSVVRRGVEVFPLGFICSSDPSNVSIPSAVLMPFPDVSWKCAATKDSYTLIPKRANI